MNKTVKILISISLAVILTAGALSACSFGGNESVDNPETAAKPAAAEKVSAEEVAETGPETTTEDTATTFPEKETREIFEGLEKDDSDKYSYLIASYSTYYHTYDVTRTENLNVAAGKINNTVIPKGKSFSFNQTVGMRTVTAGYKTAKVIADGEFVEGLGGGVCQVSSTVFEAVLRANVKILARTYHSLEISYVPLGGDATVQWNSKDFQFKNTLGVDIRLNMYCNDGKLTCEVYSKKKVDVGDVEINIFADGGSYVLTRTVDGTENYRTVSHYSKPKPSTTKKKKKDGKKAKDKDKKDKDKKEDKEDKEEKEEKEEKTEKATEKQKEKEKDDKDDGD